jgi:hypothetical protein
MVTKAETTASTFILQADTAIDAAVTAVSQGRTDLGIFIAWAKSSTFPPTSAAALLPLVISQQLTAEEFAAISAEWNSKRETAIRAEASTTGQLRVAVGKRGGLCLYGINAAMPVTLYRGQWVRLLGYVDQIKAALEANTPRFFSRSEFCEIKGKGGAVTVNAEDAALFDEYRAGKHPHAKAGKGKDAKGAEVDGVYVSLSDGKAKS